MRYFAEEIPVKVGFLEDRKLEMDDDISTNKR